MTKYCEVCGDELPNPFEDGSFVAIEAVDTTVRIGHPDRSHNHEVIREVDVCGRDCVDKYIADNRDDRMVRHYTYTIDYRDDHS